MGYGWGVVDPRLFEAKLGALVRSRWQDAAAALRTRSLPWGAAAFAGDSAWVLAEEDARRALGPALAMADREGATDVHVMTGDVDAAGVLARRAPLFESAPAVWRIAGVELTAAEPAPVPEYTEPSADVLETGELIHLGGAEPIVEHGHLLGEVRGLEVCRVVDDESGEPVLQIGVGKYDREVHHEKHQGRPTRDALFGVVRSVLEYRVPGGEGNPAFHLAPERWLRWAVLRRPDLVGAAKLDAADSPVPRHDLRQPAPAPAAGVDTEGRPLLVVCGAGGDLDFVPSAADAWLADGRKPRLVLCVPEGDDHPVLRSLAGQLRIDAEVVTVPSNWREL